MMYCDMICNCVVYCNGDGGDDDGDDDGISCLTGPQGRSAGPSRDGSSDIQLSTPLTRFVPREPQVLVAAIVVVVVVRLTHFVHRCPQVAPRTVQMDCNSAHPQALRAP